MTRSNCEEKLHGSGFHAGHTAPLNQAGLLRLLPAGVTDLDHFRVWRCDRAGALQRTAEVKRDAGGYCNGTYAPYTG